MHLTADAALVCTLGATGVQQLDVTVCYVFWGGAGLLRSAKHLFFSAKARRQFEPGSLFPNRDLFRLLVSAEPIPDTASTQPRSLPTTTGVVLFRVGGGLNRALGLGVRMSEVHT